MKKISLIGCILICLLFSSCQKKEIVKEKLATPEDINLVYDSINKTVTINFKEVTNASGYHIYIYLDDEVYKIYDLPNGSLIKDLPNGTYKIEVMAVDESNTYYVSNISRENHTVTISDQTDIETNNPLTKIYFKGLESQIVNYNSNYHIMSGIRVVGNDGATYLVNIKTTSSIELVNNCIPNDFSGEVTFTYQASYNDLTAYGTKKVIVLDASGETEGDNVITNGDFTSGLNSWTLSNHEGASSTLSIVDGSLKVAINSLNQTNASSPRINSDNFTLEKGVTYEVSFEAWATGPKAIQVQLGELFLTSPYFLNYMSQDPQVFLLSKEKKIYSFTFTYNETTSNNVTILFEMGIVTGMVNIEDVYYDNIKVTSTIKKVKDLVVPKITGTNDKVIYVNSKSLFDPLEGIKAFDDQDGDITNQITYTIKQNGVIVNTIDQKKEGLYEIYYLVSDNSYNTTQKITQIKVVEMSQNEGNLIINGTMEQGLTNWFVAIHEGGFASSTVTNGVMEIKMTGINWNDNSSSPRLSNFTPFTLIKGESYKVSFDAYADENKRIIVQIGELYEMSPYWLDLLPQVKHQYTLTSELTHYEFLFVNEMKNTDLGYITFGLGVVDEDNTITNVYFDNINLEHLTYDLGDYIAPEIKGLSNKWFFSGEITSYDFLKDITCYDNIDGDLTSALTYQITLNGEVIKEIDYSKEATYLVTYLVEDSSHNVNEQKIKVTILPSLSKVNNLMTNPTWKKNEDGVSEFVIEKVTKGVKFITPVTGGEATWSVRAVTNNISINNGSEYTIYFDLYATTERDIFIQVGNYDNTSNFQVQFKKVIHVTPKETRYKLSFIASNSGSFALGFEMGPGANYPYIQTEITVTNTVMIKGATYLKKPTGIVLNKIAVGTILAFAAEHPSGTKFKLYVYDKNNDLIAGAPFDIYNGQNINDLNIPSGTYTLKVQAVGSTPDVIASSLSDGFSYTK